MRTRPRKIRAVLSLGSNIADRLGNLQSGVDALRASGAARVVAVSGVYETAPIGKDVSGDFLNAIIVCLTDLAAPELLALCHRVETACGRGPSERKTEEQTGNHNRTLDVDIIFYGDHELELDLEGALKGKLVIPHPLWTQRPFVVLPLLDVLNHLTEWEARAVREVADSVERSFESCRLVGSVLN